MSNEQLEVFGFENEDIKGGMFEKYKGKKNEVHRNAIVYTDPKAMFVGSKIHFKDRFHGSCLIHARDYQKKGKNYGHQTDPTTPVFIHSPILPFAVRVLSMHEFKALVCFK